MMQKKTVRYSGFFNNWLVVAAFSFCAAAPALAHEYPISLPHTIPNTGVQAGLVYLQPITMKPKGMMHPAAKSDVHLELDIHAVKDNPTGFADGDWIPYLQVKYVLTKQDASGKVQTRQGTLMPMVANDGPHYGDNVKLFGEGKYHIKVFIAPPATQGAAAFGRHVDRETGVGPWFKPFTVEKDFIFAGIGKKGGY
jgi:uncharacterized protein involved in high-affinity Fe2+ transport